PAAAELTALAGAHGSGPTAPLVDAIEHVAARARSERSQLGRVTRRLGVPPVRAYERPGDAVGSIAEAFHAEPDLDGLEAEPTPSERRLADRRRGDRRSAEASEERR
ncbi:MAG: hypothetical protein Q7T55_06725, partial [Solirubrobacteraceae bacterium]|nr:hypothetical protein [Solirubrobacteraceae bacterium]